MTKWLAGVVPGAIAAVVASLVSLPLKSPDDAFLNSGTVTIGALVAGLVIGAVWTALNGKAVAYAAAVVAAFVPVVVAGALGESLLSGSFKFVAPLGAIVFGICAVLTPLTDRLLRPAQLRLGGAGLALTVALMLGLALAGRGDAPSGHLSFPEAKNNPAATHTAAQGTIASRNSATVAVATRSGATSTAASRSVATRPPVLRTVAASTGGPGPVATSPAALGTPASPGITASDVRGVTFGVVPGESQLAYTVRERLVVLPSSSNAVGSTGALNGQVHLDGRPSTISVDMSTLMSDQARRDRYVRDVIFNTDPTITFVVDNLSGLPATYQLGETVTRTVTGTATVRGVSKALAFSVQGRFVGDELQLLGTTDFTWSDFNIDPPNVPGVVQVEDNVHIEVLIVARPAA